MEIESVGIVGAGTMGSAIAELMAFNGLHTCVIDVDEPRIEAGRKNAERILSHLVTYQRRRVDDRIGEVEAMGIRLTAEQRDAIAERFRPDFTEREAAEVMGRISFTTEYSSLRDVSLVVEAAFEDLEVKRDIFRKLEDTVGEETILASNTSSIPITAIASAANRRERVLGTHFFNPPYTLPLVEIIPGLDSGEEVVSKVFNFFSGLRNHRKKMLPIRVKESPGFVVNRLLVPMLNEALFLIQEGIAGPEDIDAAMKAGAGMPMGPCELADMVGLDIHYHVSRILFEEFADPKYRPPLLLKRMVEAGRLGRKSGKGFYNYTR